MSTAFNYVGAGGYVGMSSTQTWSSLGLTTGAGLIALIYFGTGTTPTVAASASLSTDGACQSSSSQNGSGDRITRWYFWPNITTATQDFTVSTTGSAEANLFLWSVTGHDTADMFGAEGFSTDTPCAINGVATGSGLIAAYSSDTTSAMTLGGVGGSWSTYQAVNSRANGGSRYNTTNDAGNLSITGADGGAVYMISAVEIKAAGGGGFIPAWAAQANQGLH